MRTSAVCNVFLILVMVTSAVNGGDTIAERKKCVKTSRGVLKGFMKYFTSCNKDMDKKTPQEFQDSIGCIVKCVMKKTNILDKNDLVTEELMKKSIESTFPDEFKKTAHDKMAKCVKLHDSLDPKDPNCKSYLKLGSCMQEGITDLCGEMPMI